MPSVQIESAKGSDFLQIAVRLYQQLGFTVREHIRGFCRPHEDRYLMVHPGSGPL